MSFEGETKEKGVVDDQNTTADSEHLANIKWLKLKIRCTKIVGKPKDPGGIEK